MPSDAGSVEVALGLLRHLNNSILLLCSMIQATMVSDSSTSVAMDSITQRDKAALSYSPSADDFTLSCL